MYTQKDQNRLKINAYDYEYNIFAGSGGRFYTPMLQVPPGQKCPRQEMFGCVHFPLHKLQRQDEEKGLLFYFELYVYNMAEHFIMVRSDTFKLPSRYVPGHGTVVDIDPSAYATDMLATGNVIVETFDDVKVHFVTNVLCAAWFGFYHHQNVSFQVGIGTNDKTDNVIPFVSVSAKNIFHCFNTSKLVNNVRYFFLVKATCSAGSISVSSDGVTILDRDQAAKAIKIYAGSACENASSELLSANPSGSTNSTMYKSARKLNVGKAYTLEIRSDFELDADISSDDVVWLEDTRKEGILIRKVFRAITDFPLFMVLLNDTVSLTSVKVTILHCAQNIHAHSSSQILSAFWNVSSPFNGLIDSFYASLIRNDCKEAKFSESNKDCSTMICGLVKSNTDHNVTFEHLSLIDQRSYSVEIQACFGRLCLPSSFSSPVIVQYLPPSISIINASIESIGDDCVYLNINWKRSDCLSNYNNTAAAMYQWALALGENAESPLTLWSPVRQSHLTKQSQDTLRVRYA